MIYDNGASRIGKGLHWQIKRIKQQLARHYRKYGRAGGVLLLDLKKFFPLCTPFYHLSAAPAVYPEP